ncbi:MAG: bifunctional DNA-formamidopyrimidine glycosylase/DNA-(apurinic or apyrimidinic site) lyase [Phycisphaerales bacterium]|nr:bifunctional DNA-formamidopyrimidine glycosylase/DNA-(apurinic or apyrimidinic site) lyase [Phycisphaerales bacterium]
MPELPEVERVRTTLAPRLMGRSITKAVLIRRDVWTPAPASRARPGPAAIAAQLLEGAVVDRIKRRGKQLAIIAEDGRVLCIHLGMTGRLVYQPLSAGRAAEDHHIHSRWTIADDRGPAGELTFRDPRRFGGLWSLNSPEQLAERWMRLGPDGLGATGPALWAALHESRRAVKAGLLDQAVIAGVGNIYADEALFRAGIDPRRRCDRIAEDEWVRLAEKIRAVFRSAIAAGGSTLRDYVDGDGSPGLGRDTHQVYGRGGQPCLSCGQTLRITTLAQRTTVFCARCQPRTPRRSHNSSDFSTRPPDARSGRRSGLSDRAGPAPVSTVMKESLSSSQQQRVSAC